MVTQGRNITRQNLPQIGLYTTPGILSIIIEMFTEKIEFYTLMQSEREKRSGSVNFRIRMYQMENWDCPS